MLGLVGTGAEESDTCVVCRAWEVLVVSEAECVPELSQFSLGLVGATTDCGVVSSIVVEGTSVSVGRGGGGGDYYLVRRGGLLCGAGWGQSGAGGRCSAERGCTGWSWGK